MAEIPTSVHEDQPEQDTTATPMTVINKPFKHFGEGEKPLTVEAALANFERLITEGKKIALVTDLDGTVVPYHKDPRLCQIDPKAKAALEQLNQSGVEIVVMTGRSGAEGARLIGIPGATIIGTAGWEVYRVDPNDPTKGESFIHEDLVPYARDITSLLQAIRVNFFQDLIGDIAASQSRDMTAEVASPDGPIIFERKAINSQFPEGLSLNFNFNQVPSEHWDKYTQALTSLFETNIPEEIKDIMQIKVSQSTSGDFPACSVSISPKGEEGKDKSIINLLREDDDPRRAEYFRGLPGGFDGMVFVGDTNQDAKAMRAAHLAAVLVKKRRLESTGIVVARPDQVGQEKALRFADVATQDISGNAELLTSLANIAQRQQTTQQESQ